ncbi:MAG: outer membrane beta-barrel protein [Acidobacteria bacterium]|nr:outer membrane beta-barrel protein [Acidobacteriota bacterium]
MSTHVIRTLEAALIVGAAVLATPSVARADDWNNWFVSPFIGAQLGGDAPRTSPAVGVSGGWMGSRVGGEFDLGYGPEFFDQNGFITDRRMITMMGNAIAPIPWVHSEIFKPYIVGGLGVLKPKLSEAGGIFALDARKFGMDLGGGVMTFVNPHVGLRGDVRYFRGLRKSDADTNDFGLDLSTFHFWRVSAGLVTRF